MTGKDSIWGTRRPTACAANLAGVEASVCCLNWLVMELSGPGSQTAVCIYYERWKVDWRGRMEDDKDDRTTWKGEGRDDLSNF